MPSRQLLFRCLGSQTNCPRFCHQQDSWRSSWGFILANERLGRKVFFPKWPHYRAPDYPEHFHPNSTPAIIAVKQHCIDKLFMMFALRDHPQLNCEEQGSSIPLWSLSVYRHGKLHSQLVPFLEDISAIFTWASKDLFVIQRHSAQKIHVASCSSTGTSCCGGGKALSLETLWKTKNP